MRPLTETIPKPLVEVCGKPLLQHVVEALPPEVDEVILVVGYKEDLIRAYCGDSFCGRRMTYVSQKNYSGGTGDALLCAERYVSEKFLFMYADDIHGAPAIARAITYDGAILASRAEHPERFGVLLQNTDGTLRGIIEKPKDPPSDIVNIGGFVLEPSIFHYRVSISEEHGELLVTDMITAYAADHPVTVVMQDRWIPVGKPEDIIIAESILRAK